MPKPRAHLTRYHGVFAPASPERAQIVPATRGAAVTECAEATVTSRQRSPVGNGRCPGPSASSGCSPSTSRPADNPAAGCACIAAFNLPSTPRLQHASTDSTESAAQTKAAYTSYSLRVRSPNRDASKRASIYGEFCLGDLVTLREVVEKVMIDLEQREYV